MSARQDARQDIIALLERHLGIPARGLGPDTAIGKRAVKNSIQIHRFYAEMGRAGYAVQDYFTIQTFGQLLDALGLSGARGSVEVAGSGAVGLREGEATGAGAASGSDASGLSGASRSAAASGEAAPDQAAPGQRVASDHDSNVNNAAPDQADPVHHDPTPDQAAPFLPLSGLGVDAQPVDQMPRPGGGAPTLEGLLAEPFYQENFTQAELAHALDRPDPWATLAGLFAAKEAVVKADPGRGGGRLKEVAIGHDADGRPGLPGFRLSITHAGNLALAVALAAHADHGSRPVRQGAKTAVGPTPAINPTRPGRPLFPGWVLFATGLALGLGAALLWG